MLILKIDIKRHSKKKWGGGGLTSKNASFNTKAIVFHALILNPIK